MCSSYWFALASIVGVVNTRSLPRAKHEWKHEQTSSETENLGWKKTFLYLILKHQCGNVESWLESWNGHFTNSHTPWFSTKHVLFYLVKRHFCCFEWSNLKPFSLTGARLMARMAQFAPEIYLRTWKTHHEKLYNKCSNL